MSGKRKSKGKPASGDEVKQPKNIAVKDASSRDDLVEHYAYKYQQDAKRMHKPSKTKEAIEEFYRRAEVAVTKLEQKLAAEEIARENEILEEKRQKAAEEKAQRRAHQARRLEESAARAAARAAARQAEERSAAFVAEQKAIRQGNYVRPPAGPGGANDAARERRIRERRAAQAQLEGAKETRLAREAADLKYAQEVKEGKREHIRPGNIVAITPMVYENVSMIKGPSGLHEAVKSNYVNVIPLSDAQAASLRKQTGLGSGGGAVRLRKRGRGGTIKPGNETAARFLASPQYAAHPEKWAHLNAMVTSPTFRWDGGDLVSPRPGPRMAMLSLNSEWYSPGIRAWTPGFKAAVGGIKAVLPAVQGLLTGDPKKTLEGIKDGVQYAVQTGQHGADNISVGDARDVGKSLYEMGKAAKEEIEKKKAR